MYSHPNQIPGYAPEHSARVWQTDGRTDHATVASVAIAGISDAA